MISLNFSIRNLWGKSFKNVWSRAYHTPFKHKFLELQIYRDASIAVVNANWTVKQDHAGLEFEVGLLGFCFDINFYDCRHWDNVKNQWEVNYNA